jgi:hypothetical protein
VAIVVENVTAEDVVVEVEVDFLEEEESVEGVVNVEVDNVVEDVEFEDVIGC